MEQSIKYLIADVHAFNEIAGNYSKVNKDKLFAQAKCILEEAKEFYEALQQKDNDEEVLKECVDLLVTVIGAAGMLQTLEYDVGGAFDTVNLNNLSKFPSTYGEAIDSVNQFKEQGITVSIAQAEDHDMFVLKDENGKVRKKATYQKYSVKDYVGFPLDNMGELSV